MVVTAKAPSIPKGSRKPAGNPSQRNRQIKAARKESNTTAQSHASNDTPDDFSLSLVHSTQALGDDKSHMVLLCVDNDNPRRRRSLPPSIVSMNTSIASSSQVDNSDLLSVMTTSSAESGAISLGGQSARSRQSKQSKPSKASKDSSSVANKPIRRPSDQKSDSDHSASPSKHSHSSSKNSTRSASKTKVEEKKGLQSPVGKLQVDVKTSVPPSPGPSNPSSPGRTAHKEMHPSRTANTSPTRGVTSPRKITKTEEKFLQLTKALPHLKVDVRMKQTIIQSLKEINCWSDDEEEEELRRKEEEKLRPSPRKRVRGRDANGSPMGSDHAADSPTRSMKSTSYDLPEDVAAENMKASTVHTIDELSQPSSIRNKVSLVKPKQIPEQKKLSELAEKMQAERNAARDSVMQQAIGYFVTQRKEYDQTQHMSVLSILKEQSSSKYVAVKRATFGIVDRAVKRAKAVFVEQAKKYQIREEKYLVKVHKYATKFAKMYRRYRLRKFCAAILKAGKQKRFEQYILDQKELYEYRLRVIQRKLEEDVALKEWKQGQKVKSTFPMKEVPEDEILNAVLTPQGQVVLATKADKQLLSQDPKVTRPDLAPFSTMINQKIYAYIKPIPLTNEDIVRTNDHYAYNDIMTVTEVSPRASYSANTNSSSAAVSRIPTAPNSVRSPRATPGTSKEQGGNYFFGTNFNPVTGQVTRTIISPAANQPPVVASPREESPRSSPRGSPLKSSAIVAPTVVMKETKYDMQVPLWEQMARLDMAPPIKQVAKDPKYKSPAYRALEKLCGLTEEDIKNRQLQISFSATASTTLTPRRPDGIPPYSTSLLSLFRAAER